MITKLQNRIGLEANPRLTKMKRKIFISPPYNVIDITPITLKEKFTNLIVR